MFSKLLAAGAALLLMASSPALAQTQLKLATDSGAKGSPSGDALDRWAKLIEDGTNGEVQVDVFYQNELGSQAEVFDLFVAGDVDLMINWPITAYDERLGVLFTPYMVTSWEEAFEAYKPGGWVNTMLVGIYDDLGLKFFGPWPEGFNGVASRGKYAMTPEEASSLKIRVPAMFPMAESVQALGYQTATIDWSEVFTAIQTGVVDGDGANIIYWDYEYFRDVLDYYNQTKMQFVTGIIAMNSGSWDKLTPEQQKVVEESALTVMEEAFEQAQERDQGYIEKAKEAGMNYIEPSPEQLKEMAERVRSQVWPMMESRVGAEIMETIRANAGGL
ncbi:TRAP transporter substrate-binding protein DctP [Tianweitania sediminis]|jgi:TRAP-type C4-dicarboxylate transport system substrate-binding protein|uniref:TRAP transporter substrate-binding protein DctP n=1 Tax=Tianweitania sediminis TaxID=1502156 RepID=A0A8J7RGZ3_9HYPH|nr:TRAP transporter substrate-binding protein DctP [Tianweitania sediminis]MBP0437076.1 TRAP transporter substrate-binding protein DctP [Tianweitania sediminis]HEV7414611.1 TRAP transporter substrate-binding protein DctP [Tianweitania sediminis]